MLKKIFLLPLSWIYTLVVRLRNFLYDIKVFKSVSFEIPIIAVGNITVGGTGKTPHTEMLIRLLRKEYNIAVLSRGYKRKTKGFVIAAPTSTTEEIGDELKQIKQKFPGITVAADEDRVRGVRQIQKSEPDIDLILLDDAFQHRHINPGLSILLIDYNRPPKDDYFLPYGNLRDTTGQIRRAHVIIVTKTPCDIKPIEMRVISQNLDIKPYQTIFFTGLKYGMLQSVFPGSKFPVDEQRIKAEQWQILVVAGIASPRQLIDYAKSLSPNIKLLEYPDHHRYSTKDIQKISTQFNAIKSEKKFILTTEKDAMRLMDLNIKDSTLRNQLFYVPVEPSIINENQSGFKEYISNYIQNAENDYKFYSTHTQSFNK